MTFFDRQNGPKLLKCSLYHANSVACHCGVTRLSVAVEEGVFLCKMKLRI